MAPNRPGRPASALAQFFIDIFWVVLFGVVMLFVFFAALGAYSVSDSGVVFAVVVIVVLLLGVRLWARSIRKASGRDPRLVSARERRGF